MTHIKVTSTSWDKDRAFLKEIRRQVFIIEQGVDERLEWDDQDKLCEHFVAFSGDEAVGCARLINNKIIGRMAVLKAYRGKGVGREIVDHIKRHASQKRYTKLELSAQCHAYGFYSKCGFNACSAPYEDAEIPHINMEYRVFSHEENGNKQYSFQSDSSIYHSKTKLETRGYFDMLIGQCSHSITACIKDIKHPILSNESFYNRIKFLARNNKHFKVQLLIGNYHPNFNDTAIFRLQQRLPSFIEIRSTKEITSTSWMFDRSAWVDTVNNEVLFCFSDKAKIKHDKETFRLWWDHSKSILDTKRLSI